MEFEPPEIDHPSEGEALKDPLVKEINDFVDSKREGIWRETHPDGRHEEDDVFYLDEGIFVRPPILISWIVEHLRERNLLKT